MSFKSALLYDMDCIIEEMDDVETEDLLEISEKVIKFYYLLINEVGYRNSLK